MLGVALTGCARTPVVVAERFSGLDVPETAHLLEFVDEASGLVGEDVFVRVALRLSKVEFDQLLKEAQTLGYAETSSAPALPG